MKWIQDFTLVMRSSVTAFREKVQDPERMLHQLIIDMEEELGRVRKGVAEAIADEIQLKRQVEKAREETRVWLDRATAALTRNDEEKSRAALARKVESSKRAETLDEEYRKQKTQTAKLQRSVQDLGDKIRQARQKRTLLLARLVRANSEQKIHRTLSRANRESAFSQFDQLEKKVERTEALADAYDRLEDRDPDQEDLAEDFENQEKEEILRSEFEALRKRIEKKDE